MARPQEHPLLRRDSPRHPKIGVKQFPVEPLASCPVCQNQKIQAQFLLCHRVSFPQPLQCIGEWKVADILFSLRQHAKQLFQILSVAAIDHFMGQGLIHPRTAFCFRLFPKKRNVLCRAMPILCKMDPHFRSIPFRMNPIRQASLIGACRVHLVEQVHPFGSDAPDRLIPLFLHVSFRKGHCQHSFRIRQILIKLANAACQASLAQTILFQDSRQVILWLFYRLIRLPRFQRIRLWHSRIKGIVQQIILILLNPFRGNQHLAQAIIPPIASILASCTGYGCISAAGKIIVQKPRSFPIRPGFDIHCKALAAIQEFRRLHR